MGRRATQITANDWQELIDHPALRSVWLAGVSDAQIESIAVSRPNMAISNSRVYFVGGLSVTTKEYFEWRHATFPVPAEAGKG